MDLPHYDFTEYYDREALVVEDKIVYFGSSNEKITFVLEKEEESEKLKEVREDEGFNLLTGAYNTSSCVFKNEIYAFAKGNYEEVHRYSLGSGKWSLFCECDLD